MRIPLPVQAIAVAAIILTSAPRSVPAETAPPAETTKRHAIVGFAEVKRPTKEFMDQGEYVGISPSMHRKLGIIEGSPILLKSPEGVIVGVHTKEAGISDDTILIKETIRSVLKINDGKVNVLATTFTWPSGVPSNKELSAIAVAKPPKDFLKHGEACGISYSLFRELNCAPGAKARLRTDSGEKVVVLQLLDRGAQTIALRQSLREALGIAEEGPASVRIRVIAPAPASGGELPPGGTAARAAEETTD